VLSLFSRNEKRQRIHVRIRSRIRGGKDKPRLNIFRSLDQIYAQLIDDTTGHTLLAVSSRDKEVRKVLKNGGNVAGAKTVGKVLAERAKAAGIASVVFDRGGYAYHGRVKALAEAAREGGLQF
jgi:large subunit ribosomal protein L18